MQRLTNWVKYSVCDEALTFSIYWSYLKILAMTWLLFHLEIQTYLYYRDSGEISTRELQKMVQALPQYSEQIDKLSLHVEVSFLSIWKHGTIFPWLLNWLAMRSYLSYQPFLTYLFWVLCHSFIWIARYYFFIHN